MEDVISRGWQRKSLCRDSQKALTAMTKKPCVNIGDFSLRLAQEGDWVRIVSTNGRKGFHDRLAGVGLRVGAEVQVLRNSMNGKLLLGHEGTRLFLGGGMAHKIQVVVIEGGDK
jgi:Fe2+ transport system protein FeoA